jgi:hypothetical protein
MKHNSQINEIVNGFIKLNKIYTDNLLEFYLEEYYSNNPIPIEKRPMIWIKVSNLLESHYGIQS